MKHIQLLGDGGTNFWRDSLQKIRSLSKYADLNFLTYSEVTEEGEFRVRVRLRQDEKVVILQKCNNTAMMESA